MPLPAPLLKAKSQYSKKDFGHVLIIAGSPSMLGACALSSLAAMRSGAGLVTAAVPRHLNLTLQKKISNVVMTRPLAQTKNGGFSAKACRELNKIWDTFDAVAIGPGLGREEETQRFVREIIVHCPKPLVVDADALFALSSHVELLLKAKAMRVLTPHAGEMARLKGETIKTIESHRVEVAGDFARRYNCVLLLKGKHTVVASAQAKIYINRTGNVGLATAGSGDVLTGMITAFLGQGNDPYRAACWGAYRQGQAADRLVKLGFSRGMIASDIIESIPYVLKSK